MISSCIYAMVQVLPVLCADCGISQPSTEGFQSWQNHHDLKASLSFTYVLLFAQVTPLHTSGLWQRYHFITMSRKPLPERREKKGCHLSQISIEMIWFGAVKKAISVRQLMVTYSEVSELFKIRQCAKSMDHEKDLTQFLRTKLLKCSSLLKYVKL